MAFFVRPSKYRHVYGTCAKRDVSYDNIRVSANAWDTNIVKVNPRFLSINWQASGGGAFAVVSLAQVGKLPENFPLYRGHTAPVLDTDFNPFNDYIIASGSEDSKVMIWSIPEEYSEGQEEVLPILKLSGHGRKVGQVLFNPVADNVLASASTDLTIKLWDIEKGVERQQVTGHTEIIQDMAWNYNGSLLATTCRDKKLRLFDVRVNKVVQEGAGHQGVKGSRVVWLGQSDRLATTGFSKMSDRQLNLWDATDLSKPIKQDFLDTSSGVIMPFYDSDTKILYLAGKGDGNIRYYEYDNDALYPLSEFKAAEPQRGMAFLPKRALNVNDCEIDRAYKVSSTIVEPISFTVPRKSDAFQSDIFPSCLSDEPALTAEEWFGGKNADPKLLDLQVGFIAKSKKEFTPTQEKVTYQEAFHEARKENEELRGQLSQRDVKIRVLEIEAEKLRLELKELNLSKAIPQEEKHVESKEAQEKETPEIKEKKEAQEVQEKKVQEDEELKDGENIVNQEAKELPKEVLKELTYTE